MDVNLQPSGLTSQGTYSPDNLIAGCYKTDQITIKSGAGVLKRGTVLECVVPGTAASAAKSGGNTGNGAMTLDATTPVLTGAKPGVYTVRCIAAATNSGTFRVTAPDGSVLGDVAVAATFSNKIKFVIADGATDFIVGDGFDVTVTASSTPLYQAVTSDVNAAAILAEDVDATSSAKTTVGYIEGSFNQNELTLGVGATLAGVKSALKLVGIYLYDAVSN